MINIKKIALPLFVAAALAGCSPYTPINVKFHTLDSPFSYYHNKLSPNTSLHINKVIDNRIDKSSLGMLGDHPVNSKKFATWVKNSFKRIEKNCHGDQCQALTITVKIKKAYVEGAANIINANILVDVYYYKNGKFISKIPYRGYDSSVDWTNTNSDYSRSLNNALRIILNKVASHIKKLQ